MNATSTVFAALRRARFAILSVALTYLVAVAVGAAMVHGGSPLALNRRDAIVGQAAASDPSSLALSSGHRLQAAFLDLGRNLALGAVPDTILGLAVVLPYPSAAYRGWVGGIVSVDENHVSRLAQPGEAVYYLVTLALQLIPYSLAGGAGVYLGVWFMRAQTRRGGPKWLGLPRQALLDVLRIYCLIVPLFLIASLWEFLLR